MKHIKIKTSIPHPQDLELIKELNKVSPLSMQEHQLPIVWDSAKDYLVWDRWGNVFIDFTSSIFVANSGHSNPDILNALRKQINGELIHSYTFANEIKLEYLQKLTTFTGYDKAFLLSSGTEATEAACKIMRKNKRGLGIILSFSGAMHGKTFFAEALKGVYNEAFVKVLDYPKLCYHWEDTIKNLNIHFIDNACGIIIESYRGFDVDFFSPFYIQELIKWAKEHNILVCFDEIQAGFGRTGKLFAYEWYNIPKPDLVCCGKGLSGGLPISAVLGNKKLLDSCDDLSSTNSANPLVCAGALANLEYIEKHNLINKSLELGKILYERLNIILEKNSMVEGNNSCGLVGALILKSKRLADEVCFRCAKKGLLLVRTGRETIKIGPPLTITKIALNEGLDVLEEVINEISRT